MGPRYYRLVFRLTPVDVFAVLPPADWGVILAIRTGSAEYSHWLVTEALRRGFKVESGQLYRIHREEQPWRFEKIPCPDERVIFNSLGLAYPDPESREVRV